MSSSKWISVCRFTRKIPFDRCRVERRCRRAGIVSSRIVEARAQNLHAAPDTCADGIVQARREVGREFGFDRTQGIVHSAGDSFDGIPDQLSRKACGIARLEKMPGLYFVDAVVAVRADRHREFHLLALDLACIEAGLGSQYIVERCQRIASTGMEEDAEVLGVAVGCTD